MTMNLGADVKDARRRFPLAVTAGMLTVVGLYLALNFAYVRTLGVGGVAGSKLVAAALARASLGHAGEAVVSALIFLSAAGFVNATVLQMPRSYYAMAEDGVLPRVFLRVAAADAGVDGRAPPLRRHDARARVPSRLVREAPQLRDLHGHAHARRRLLDAVRPEEGGRQREDREGEDGAFRIPGFPVLPALYVLALAAVAAHVAVTEPRLALAGTAILFTGWPLFLLGRRLSRGR